MKSSEMPWGVVPHEDVEFARPAIRSRYRYPFHIDTLYCDAQTVSETYKEVEPFDRHLEQMLGIPTNWYQNDPGEWNGKRLDEEWTHDGHGLYVFRTKEQRRYFIEHGVFVPEDTIRPWREDATHNGRPWPQPVTQGPIIEAWCRARYPYIRCANYFLFTELNHAFEFKIRWG